MSFNFIVAVGIILSNKLVLGRVGFNFPIFPTLIHYAVVWILLAFFKSLSLLPLSPPSKTTPFSSLFSLGAVMAFASGLANTSLKHNRFIPQSCISIHSSEIRVSKEDLEKERGDVMEEYRGNRNATGRMQDSHWQLMMESFKYAERLPIGLEKVIRSVPAATVKQFYQKWYHLCNMAVVAVGDFPDTKTAVDLIKTHFDDKRSISNPPEIPVFLVPSHEDTWFSCFVESEAAGVSQC